MRNLLLLNMVLGVGLAYAAVHEYRRDAPTFRLLAAVSGLSLAISLSLARLP